MSEYRPGGFQILPPVIKNLIIINVLVFAATYMLKAANVINLDYYLGLFHWKSPLFKPWQVITHMFMHGSFMHLFANMFGLWMFGNIIEQTLGAKRFLIFYFVCGLGAALCYILVFNWDNAADINWFSHLTSVDQQQMVNQIATTGYGYARAFPMVTPMVGASGALFGVLFAFGYLYPNMEIYYYFLIPLKAKYLVAIYAVIEIISGLQNNPTDNVAHFAHIGGMIFAFFLLKAWKLASRRSLY